MNQVIKDVLINKYDRIKDFLLTSEQTRTNEELIDMRNILEGFPFFMQFTNTKSQDFISMCRHLLMENYSQSCTLFSQGDSADKFYMVLKGQVSIYVQIAGVTEQKLVGQLGVGGAFGELALLFDSERNATIKVDSATQLMVLHKNDFKKYMRFQSSDHANQAFNLINSMDEFKNLEFPDRVKLASKMDYKSFPSNHTIIQQGQTFNHFFLILSGLIKFYRDIEFNTTISGSINFNSEIKQGLIKQGKQLKIEIDEVGPGRFFGEYELISYKSSQFTAVTHMPCNVFILSQFDFNLMNQSQLQNVCQAAKPYPNDQDIRQVFLEGVQWRVFREQLVSNLKQKNPQARDPKAILKEKYNKDMRMFAINTLTFDSLLKNYIQDSQNHVLTSGLRPHQDDQDLGVPNNSTLIFGSEGKLDKKKNALSMLSEMDASIRQMNKLNQLPVMNLKTGDRERRRQGPTTSKLVLPKINPKVGSSVYNILISY